MTCLLEKKALRAHASFFFNCNCLVFLHFRRSEGRSDEARRKAKEEAEWRERIFVNVNAAQQLADPDFGLDMFPALNRNAELNRNYPPAFQFVPYMVVEVAANILVPALFLGHVDHILHF